MPVVITMPRLSDTMEEGTMVKWNVKVGDTVSSGDALGDVETDKATMEVPTFDDGVVAKLCVNEGETVPIETPILILAEAGESIEDAVGAEAGTDTAAAPTGTPASAPPSAPPPAAQAPKPGGDGKVRVSPLARKLADEYGVDIASVTGTGPDGRIIKRDILKAASGGAPAVSPRPAGTAVAAPAAITPVTAAATNEAAVVSTSLGGPGLEARTVPLSQMRKTIARRLVESKTTVPHFQVTVAINMDPLMQLRQTLNSQLETQGIKLSVNDFLTRATAIAMLQHPEINSSWGDDAITYHGTVNVGVAISLPVDADGAGGGLVVATVRDVQLKGLRQLSAEVRDLAARARTGGLSLDEMNGSTVTISNLGMPKYGVDQFTAIVNPPNAAILAVGAAMLKPVVRDGELTVGTEMNITLSGDHRVIDGALAAEYLATLRGMIENPASLLV